MKYLLLGVVFGVITGVQLMDQMELKHFNVVIGALVVGFVVFDELPDSWTLCGAMVVVASGLYSFHWARTATISG